MSDPAHVISRMKSHTFLGPLAFLARWAESKGWLRVGMEVEWYALDSRALDFKFMKRQEPRP